MEDDLRDSLTHANREREELLERLAYFQGKTKSQQDDIRWEKPRLIDIYKQSEIDFI